MTDNRSAEVRSQIVNRVGTIILDRPRAINALSIQMIDAIAETLQRWIGEELVDSIKLRSDGERGFCAGADVRQLRDILLADGPWMEFFEHEYALDLLIAESPIPVTTYMTGITMGGGLGLTAHAQRRIVSADATLAMPETRIGFFPDCALMHQLSRGGAVGTHLALTGNNFGAGEALRLNIADEATGEVTAPLFDAEWIQECYQGDDVVEIMHRLEAHPNPEAQSAAADIRARSPFAVVVSMQALRRAQTMTLAEVFAQDLALARRMLPVDFAEGVRARLVDKDDAPRWRWERIEDVPASAVDEVFDF